MPVAPDYAVVQSPDSSVDLKRLKNATENMHNSTVATANYTCPFKLRIFCLNTFRVRIALLTTRNVMDAQWEHSLSFSL